MRRLVDVLVGLAVLVLLVAVGLRFFSPNLGFAIFHSFVTPLFLWRAAMAHPPPQRLVASTWAAGEPQVRQSRSITRASQTWKVGRQDNQNCPALC